MSSESLTPEQRHQRFLEERAEDREERDRLIWRGPQRSARAAGPVAVQTAVESPALDSDQVSPPIPQYSAKDSSGMPLAEEVEGEVVPPTLEAGLPTNEMGETIPIAKTEDLKEDHDFTFRQAS